MAPHPRKQALSDAPERTKPQVTHPSVTLSRWRHGFESRTGCNITPGQRPKTSGQGFFRFSAVVQMAPMYLQQLQSGSWRVTVSVDGGRRRATAKTKGEARRLGAQMLLDMGGAPTSTPTVAEIIDAHLSDATYAPRTRAEVERAVSKLPAVFLERRVADVSPSVMAGLWREMTAAGRSAHELKRVRDVLSKAWRRAITLEWAGSNPVLLVPPPSPRQAEEIVPPTRAEVRAILDAAGDRPLGLFLRLAAVTGARRGELCGLQWDDLRLEVPEVIIRRTVAESAGGLVYGEGKTGRGGHRVLNLDPLSAKGLRRHHRIVGSRWVFTFDGDTPWRPSYVSREFHRICTALGDPHRLNDLRHHAATEWLAAGTPVPTVAQMLGHATASTTLKVYAHFIPAQARDTILAHAAALDAG